jgi:hypothetical protein
MFKRYQNIRILKAFPRVWLFWGKYWAFQAYFYPCVSFGVHIDPNKPLLDIHFLFFTLAIGREPHITGQAERHVQSCRGFLFETDPHRFL